MSIAWKPPPLECGLACLGGPGQARKDIEGGGVYVNNMRESSSQRHVTSGNLLFGRHLLLRKGKRNYVVLTAR